MRLRPEVPAGAWALSSAAQVRWDLLRSALFILSSNPDLAYPEVQGSMHVGGLGGSLLAAGQRGCCRGRLESQRKGHRDRQPQRARETGTERKTGRKRERQRGEQEAGMETKRKGSDSQSKAGEVWWPQRRERREETSGRGARGVWQPCPVGQEQQCRRPWMVHGLGKALSPGDPGEEGLWRVLEKATSSLPSLVPLASAPQQQPAGTDTDSSKWACPTARGLGQGTDQGRDGPCGVQV